MGTSDDWDDSEDHPGIAFTFFVGALVGFVVGALLVMIIG